MNISTHYTGIGFVHNNAANTDVFANFLHQGLPGFFNVAARQKRGTLGHSIVNQTFQPRPSACVNNGASGDVDGFVKPDLCGSCPVDDLFRKGIAHRFDDEDAVGGHADLPCITELHACDNVSRQIKVSILKHQHGRVAT